VEANLETLIQWGLPGLFLSAFLAATVLPLSSELVLGLLLSNGCDPAACLLIATLGNVLGSVVNYMMGFWGSRFLVKKILPIKKEDFARARDRLKRYGTLSLLFAWVPVIGDPLTLAAGVLKTNFILFLILVTTGKAVRYIAIAALGKYIF